MIVHFWTNSLLFLPIFCPPVLPFALFYLLFSLSPTYFLYLFIFLPIFFVSSFLYIPLSSVHSFCLTFSYPCLFPIFIYFFLSSCFYSFLPVFKFILYFPPSRLSSPSFLHYFHLTPFCPFNFPAYSRSTLHLFFLQYLFLSPRLVFHILLLSYYFSSFPCCFAFFLSL